MKKQLIKDEIFTQYFNGLRVIRVSDFKVDLQPDDIIEIEHNEAEHFSDHGWDDHTVIRVLRERMETDEEFEERKKEMEKLRERSKNQRYQQYLKLKKEFEPEE